jgi:hypothetical protein
MTRRLGQIQDLVCRSLQGFSQPRNDDFLEDFAIGPDPDLPSEVATGWVNPRSLRSVALAQEKIFIVNWDLRI